MKRLDNKGLSLVELIISVGIFALVMIAIMRILTVSTKTYSANNDEINAQNEAQALMNQLDNIISDASSLTKTVDTYILKEGTGSSAVEYRLVYGKEKNKLFYLTTTAYSTLTGEIPDNYLLSDGVNNFSISVANLDAYRYVTVDLQITKGGKTYTATKNIFLRNISVKDDDSSEGEAESTTEVSSEEASSEDSGESGSGSGSGSGSSGSSAETTAIEEKKITKITASYIGKGEGDTEKKFYLGDILNGSNVSVTKYYEDGTSAACTNWRFENSYSSYRPTEGGTITVKEYDSGNYYTASFELTMTDISKIEAKLRNDTAVYEKDLKKSDVLVWYTYSDNTTRELASNEFGMTKLNNKYRIWSYRLGKNVTVELSVISANGFRAELNPVPAVGASITKDNFKAYLQYGDGSEQEVDFTVTGIPSDGKMPKKYKFTVKHGSYKAEIKNYDTVEFRAELDAPAVGADISKSNFKAYIMYDGVAEALSEDEFTVSGIPADKKMPSLYSFTVKYGKYTYEINKEFSAAEIQAYANQLCGEGLDVTGIRKIHIETYWDVSGYNLPHDPWWVSLGNVKEFDIDVSGYSTFRVTGGIQANNIKSIVFIP